MSSSKDPKDFPIFKGPGLYNILNSGTRTLIDLNEAGEAQIVANPGNGADSQKWIIADVGNNEYSIINRKTGTSIQAIARNTPVVSAKGHLDDQKVHWRISSPSARNPQLTQFQSVAFQGSALDLADNLPVPASPVQTWDQMETATQTWFVNPTS